MTFKSILFLLKLTLRGGLSLVKNNEDNRINNDYVAKLAFVKVEAIHFVIQALLRQLA